jgi:hypothetical protein
LGNEASWHDGITRATKLGQRRIMLKIVQSILLTAVLTAGIILAFANMRMHGALVPQPPLAQQYGFNSLAFYEPWESTATIDLTNSKAPGFNWYINGYFPVPNNWWLSSFNTKTPASPSQISVSNGIMTFVDSTQHEGNLISTCVWNGSALVGATFGGGFYLDAMMGFDNYLGADTTHSWPALWMVPAEHLTGGTGVSGHVIDTSVMEAYPGADAFCQNKCAILMGTHDEQVGQTTNAPQYTPDVNSRMQSIFGTFDFTHLHHWSFLWVPQAKNGGSVGLMQWYVDSHLILQMTYSSTSTSNPPLSPSAGNGELSYQESSHFCIFIDPGAASTGQPTYTGTVQIWQ